MISKNYVSFCLPRLFHQLVSLGYTSLGRLLALPDAHPLASSFWKLCQNDGIDDKPRFQATLSSFILKRTIFHEHPNITDDLQLRTIYQLPATAFVSDPLFNEGLSNVTVQHFDSLLL